MALESIIQIFSVPEALKDRKLELLPAMIWEQELDVLLKGSIKAHRHSNDNGERWLTMQDGIEQRPVVYAMTGH